MPDQPPSADLLRSLGRLVRGLSALFWGLPASLVVGFHTLKSEGMLPFAFWPVLVCVAVLSYGLWLLGDFQKQERIWIAALDRSRLLALIVLGLSPFLYWHNRVPANAFFLTMVFLLSYGALLLLASVNLVLQRLGAMLPDEMLRHEIRQYTVVNLNLILVTLLLASIYLVAGQLRWIPKWLGALLETFSHGTFWFLIPLVLLPLAMTMALLWKTKEVILESVFSSKDC
jgi:hypothetical protein